MEKDDVTAGQKTKRGRAISGASGGVYGLAFLGSLVYFIQHAGTFWAGVLGFLQALVWPAILVYKLFDFLNS